MNMPFEAPYIRFAMLLPYQPGVVWGPRYLYDHELVYVTRGTLAMGVGERTFEAVVDHVFLIPPGEAHRFATGAANEIHEHIGIHFDWRPLPDSNGIPNWDNQREPERMQHSFFREKRSFPCWNSDETPMLDLRGRPRVKAMLHEVVAAFSGRGELARWRAGTLLAAAFGQLAYEAQLLRDVTANPHIGADAIRRLQHVRELLEAPRSQPLSVSEAAAQVGWTADHLGRMCHEVLGTSPYRLQTNARMRQAQELLRQNRLSIAEVGRQCGYKDVSHFMATFKKETGLTARQFALLGENEDAMGASAKPPA